MVLTYAGPPHVVLVLSSGNLHVVHNCVKLSVESVGRL